MAEGLKATDCKSVLIRVRRFKSFPTHITIQCAGVTQLVESQPSKLLVASSSLVSRSTYIDTKNQVGDKSRSVILINNDNEQSSFLIDKTLM